MADGFSPADVAAFLSPAVRERIRTEIFSTLPSTNATCKERAAAGEREGLVLCANEQTAGYGRLTRQFFSPPGAGLYMSVLLRPRVDAALLPRITLAAAVAVSEAIESLGGEPVGIKWVNDIYKNGKKICGILTEGGFAPNGAPAYTVLGIGVNLAEPEGGFAPEIRETAGAVYAAGEMPTDARARLCAGILDRFFPYYDSLADAPFLAAYRARSVLTGKRITVYPGTDKEKKHGVPAFAEGIDDDFRLLVRYEDGRSEALTAGECSLSM